MDDKEPFQIYFYGGGGLGGCFQQGISQFIFERYELNHYKDRIHVAGASTGAPTVGYLLASIHDISTPE